MAADAWNPALYSQFERQRTQPARDLLARVALQATHSVFDLGCGPGNSTALLAARFGEAAVTGVDNSAAMLASAGQRLPGCRFVAADIAAWHAPEPAGLIYANAALQWVPDHASLVPRLFGQLAPGGALALQMPDNRLEPSHRLMRDVAEAGPWAGALAGAGERVGILPVADYYDMLTTLHAEVEIWRTTYHHPMPSAAAIVDWVRSTGLQPFLKPLAEPHRAEFLARYEAEIAQHYPVRADGSRLLLFPRLFIVATRPG